MSSNVFAASVHYAGNVIMSQSLTVATLNVTTSTSTSAATFSATPAAAANVLTVIGSSTTGNVVQFSNSAGGNFIMTNAGNVGIGKTNPVYAMDITGDLNFTGTFRQNGTPYVGSQWTGTSAIYFTGNVGIGTTAPSQKLHVAAGNVYVEATTSTTGQNLFVAVAGGTSTIAASSTDGITWTARTLPSSSNWLAVTASTSLFVAVAYGSTAAASSTDGITWTARTLPSSASWYAVTVNPTTGVFVAVAYNSSTAASSTDGITWTGRTLPGGTQVWQGVTCNSTTGVFVAVAGGGLNVAASSTDGITWTQRSLPSSTNWYAVTVNPTTGVFVAVAYASSTAAYSTDGITWVGRTLPSASFWYAVTVNPTTGVFVAVAWNNAIQAASSTDGITWTARTLPSSSNWYGVTVNQTTGVFVAVASGSTAAASSTDGTTWTARTLPSSSNWNAVTSAYQVTTLLSGAIGLGVAVPSYQLDLSTDGARKLTTTTWLTGSDSRIKTDIESANLQTCYDVVKSVDLKYFKWNFPEGIVPDDRHSLGFIAQEVKEVFPNAVSESNSYGYEDFLSLNVDQIDKALFGAVKHLSAKVEALEQSLASAK